MARGGAPPPVQSRQRPYSIRTRIKTPIILRSSENNASVRDHIPLEQGLRRELVFTDGRSLIVRDHIPLEQGLRQSSLQTRHQWQQRQRPYSIRTRIKTMLGRSAQKTVRKSETIFH